MNLVAVLALATYPFVVFGLFTLLRPSRGALTSFLIGWLYLPLITFDLPGIPGYGKFTACSIAILPCIFLFDSRIKKWKWSWMDAVVLGWVFAPLFSSLANNLGVWDGLSGTTNHALIFGVPYVVGRLYLATDKQWEFFGKALLVLAVSYMPLCLYEMRMSPQLHRLVYGTEGRTNWEQYGGFGSFGWQPIVFMNGPFEVSLLMVMATLVSFWAWRSKSSLTPFGVSAFGLFVTFFIFTIICKKWTGIGLMMLGLSVLATTSNLLALGLIAFPLAYMFLFYSGIWRGEGLHDFISEFSARRADSFQFRLENDKRLVERALDRPWFGWGGWGRNRVFNEDGKDITVTDSAWMITLGTRGTFGLMCQTLLFALPLASFFSRLARLGTWFASRYVRVVPLTIVLGLHLIDNLFNAFPNPIYSIVAGGVTSMLISAGVPKANERISGDEDFRS